MATLPERLQNATDHIATLAAWRERSATAMMAEKPVANFTNSTTNGSMRRSRARGALFLGLLISSDSVKEVRVGLEYRRVLYAKLFNNP